jgi:putative transposon-encoded protein
MDTIQWTLMQRQMQRQADSAALAGAFARAQGNSHETAAQDSLERDNLVALTDTEIKLTPMTVEGQNVQTVHVILETQSALPFSNLFLKRPTTIHVEANATTVTNGEYCVVSLESNSYNGAINLQGSASVSMGCGMSTNSRGSQALTASGSSMVKATHLAAVGGLKASSKNIDPDTILLPYSVSQSDPFSSLPTPTSLPNPCNTKLDVASNTTKSFSPGCYQAGTIQGTANFSPGVYYIDGGNLKVNAGAVVNGTGVTFILTSKTADTSPRTIATLDINGGATLNLSAPGADSCIGTACDYADVLFYQDRRAVLPNGNSSNTINGNASSSIQGAIYFPQQTVEFSGNSGMVTKCVQIVSRRVTFIGNNSMVNECPVDYDTERFLGTRVYLVA